MATASDITVMTSLIQMIQLAADPSSMDGMLPLEVSTASPLSCEDVQFYLVTRKNANGPALKSCLDQTTPLFNGTFDPSKPTKIVVHGWLNSIHTEFTTNTTRGYIETEPDVNVIQVDWSAIAKENYILARMKVPEVGKTIAAFISLLNVSHGNLHLVGHSLGAHVIGVAGYQFPPPHQIGTVIGLDPAGPLFWTTQKGEMITRESGKFVMILHTCGGLLGTTRDLGHVDFYANDGMPIQPGCGFDVTGGCSHARSFALHDVSLFEPTAFKATKCSSFLLYELGFCKSNDRSYFSGNVDRNASGKYFFKTSSSYPFIAK